MITGMNLELFSLIYDDALELIFIFHTAICFENEISCFKIQTMAAKRLMKHTARFQKYFLKRLKLHIYSFFQL